jgi:hypothetical protein
VASIGTPGEQAITMDTGAAGDTSTAHARADEMAAAAERLLESLRQLAKLFRLLLEPLNRGGQFTWRHRQRSDAAGDDVAVGAKRAQRTRAADERQPRAAAHLIDADHGDESDRTRSIDVRSAAGAQVEAGDVDEPKPTLALRLLPERQGRRLGPGYETNGHRPIFPDDPVCLVDAALDVGGGSVARQIDRRHLGAHVEADGQVVEQRFKRA